MERGFRSLNVWQAGKKLAVRVYKLTNTGSFAKDYSLKDQLRRCAVSIPSNIAEGDERGSNKDAVRFLYMAKGSLAELETQLEIAHEIDYLDKDTLDDFLKECTQIGRMLGSLIKHRSQ